MSRTGVPAYRSRSSAATCGASGAGPDRSPATNETQPMRIVERTFAEADRRALVDAGVHPLLARLYAARRIRSAQELDYGPARLLPPASLKGIEQAARLLADAIAAGKR